MYIIQKETKKVFEIIQFDQPHRSWFINETVCSNGKIYLTTLVDGLFLFLPFLQKNCSQHASLFEQAIRDDEFPETSRLLDVVKPEQILMIADQKGSDDLIAFKYNEEKTLNWLEKKTRILANYFKEINMYVGQGAVSASFVKSEKLETTTDDLSAIRYAHGIISDYISLELSEKLAKHLKIPDESDASKKRKSLAELEKPNVKKNKLNSDVKSEIMEESFDENVPVKKVVEKKVTVKDKALAKAAGGTRSISSFFTKK